MLNEIEMYYSKYVATSYWEIKHLGTVQFHIHVEEFWPVNFELSNILKYFNKTCLDFS